MTATETSTATSTDTITGGPGGGARHAAPGGTRGRLRRLALGGPEDPRWSRPALWAVLLLAFGLYAWNLPDGGYANSYYSAAVKSGTESWKAFFFGSLDSGSFITVDKPPMALWVMGLFARVLGFGTWSLLLPQALMGAASAAVVHATVRRAFGHRAALVAAVVTALTPIAVAINRDNNPDTLLVLLLVLAAWACQRAIESGRVRWLVAAAFFVGCGFNTKMLQAFVVVPALALAYLVAARPGVVRRIVHLLAAGVAMAVSSFWWMVVVDLIPADRRPFIGGSTDGTVWDLVIGYNGLGRILGEGGGPGGGRGGPGGGGGGFGGEAGAGRLFNDILGGQISWLLPFAALALVAGLVLLWKRPRTDAARAGLVLWGGWLAVHYVVFGFAEGTFHPYYSTAMGPAIGALTGAGAVLLYGAYRRSAAWAWVLPAGVAVMGAWSFVLLDRTPDWNPWLRWAVAAVTVLAVVALAAGRVPRLRARVAVAGLALAVLGGLAGPAAYAVSAASSPVNGTNPLAGPSSGQGFGGPGGRPGVMPGRMPGGGLPGGMPPGGQGQGQGQDDRPQGGEAPGGQAPGGQAPSGRPQGGGRPGGGGPGGGPGGQVSDQMVDYLRKNRNGARWLVAVGSSQQASSIILESGEPVIAMGGFTGQDPAMTVEKLQRYVESGQLRYILIGEGRGGPGGGGSSEVTAWVRKNGTLVDASAYGGSSGTSSPSASSSGAGDGTRLYKLS
ncbi:glycosyltransferase family 39 protein [Spirillospora sp. NPDC029432]|uniref:glycosyltransferase family 39 protein n=1 Tax=Spirillospora sp. NPDC029432 TaxID=3154599 RepID=UPI00345298A2